MAESGALQNSFADHSSVSVSLLFSAVRGYILNVFLIFLKNYSLHSFDVKQ